MKSWIIAASLAIGSSMALANSCPADMKAIDAKLASAQLSPQDMGKVKALRAQGEQLHKDGKHSESLAALAEAKKLLGL